MEGVTAAGDAYGGMPARDSDRGSNGCEAPALVSFGYSSLDVVSCPKKKQELRALFIVFQGGRRVSSKECGCVCVCFFRVDEAWNRTRTLGGG